MTMWSKTDIDQGAMQNGGSVKTVLSGWLGLTLLLMLGCEASSNPINDGQSGSGGASGSGGSSGSQSSGGSSSGGQSGSSGSSGVAGFNTGGQGTGGSPMTCDYAKFDSYRDPGAVVIVFDQSGSMADNVNGEPPSGSEPSKWTITTQAINTMLDSLPDTAQFGLMTFPTGNDDCGVSTSPVVALAPLSDTRNVIKGILSPSIEPSGGGTPLAEALHQGHEYLHSLTTIGGAKAVLLVTDGAPSPACGNADNETATNSLLAFTNWGQKTYVVGLAGSAPNLLSATAFNGDTRRFDGCLALCCETTSIFDSCDSAELAQCCHYVAEGADTQSSLSMALASFAAQFLTSCVFQVPKGDNPADFDPELVNVIITFAGEDSKVLPENDSQGWTYTDGTYDYIEIHGADCEKLLQTETKVEIALGCKTGEITIE